MTQNPSIIFAVFRLAMDAFWLAIGDRYCLLAIALFFGS